MKKGSGKSGEFNRFQHKVAEYCAAHKDTISLGMANVLSAIAHFLNAKTLSAFPSYDTLAEVAGVNRTTVIRNMNRLIAIGEVAKTQEPVAAGGCRNVYRIAFIKADFSMKAGWQTTPRSKYNKTYNINNIKYTKRVPVYNTVSPTTTGTRRQVHADIDIKASSGETHSSPTPSPTPSLLPGFKFLASHTRGENPFTRIFSSEKGEGNGLGAFIAAWSGSLADGSDARYAIEGCKLSRRSIDLIREDPVGRALELVGETSNTITRRALTMRLNRLGVDFFAGEVARMWSEKLDGKGRGWRSPAQLLLRRLDYCYFYGLAVQMGGYGADGNYSHNYAAAWSIAMGEREIVPLKAELAA